jgi:hypothetical protein
MRFVSALLLSTLQLDSTIALGSRGVFSIDDIENADLEVIIMGGVFFFFFFCHLSRLTLPRFRFSTKTAHVGVKRNSKSNTPVSRTRQIDTSNGF